jgi:hypothetical protein
MKRVLFSQLKIGETYYEYYTDSRDKFVGFDGYLAIFEEHIFFAYKKCKFYEIIPFKDIVKKYQLRKIESNLELIDPPIDTSHMNEVDRSFFY